MNLSGCPTTHRVKPRLEANRKLAEFGEYTFFTCRNLNSRLAELLLYGIAVISKTFMYYKRIYLGPRCAASKI